MLPRSTDSKSTSEALVALATEPVAMRSAKRAACPKGAARSMSSTCRGYLRARAAVVLMASVGEAVDIGHIPVAGPGGGEDDQVAGRGPPREKDFASGVRDRLLDLARGEEDDNVAPRASQPQGIPGGKGHGAHPPRDRSEEAVVKV